MKELQDIILYFFNKILDSMLYVQWLLSSHEFLLKFMNN